MTAESDLILRFANHAQPEEVDLILVQWFWFEAAELPDPREKELMRAELRLYKGLRQSWPEETFHVHCFKVIGPTDEQTIIRMVEVKTNFVGEIIVLRLVRYSTVGHHNTYANCTLQVGCH